MDVDLRAGGQKGLAVDREPVGAEERRVLVRAHHRDAHLVQGQGRTLLLPVSARSEAIGPLLPTLRATCMCVCMCVCVRAGEGDQIHAAARWPPVARKHLE